MLKINLLQVCKKKHKVLTKVRVDEKNNYFRLKTHFRLSVA